MQGHIRRYSEHSNRKSLGQLTIPESLGLNHHIQQRFEFNPEEDQESLQMRSTLNDHYNISYDLFLKSRVTGLTRYKMMVWVIKQAAGRFYTREVFALTGYYLDLYLQKRSMEDSKMLNELALAALMLATKIEGAQFPALGTEISKGAILRYEKEISGVLQYFLNPKTYVSYIDQHLQNWDAFIDQKNILSEHDKYLMPNSESFLKARCIYERMEYVSMVSSSLRYRYSDLVVNLFFVQSKAHTDNVDLTPISVEGIIQFIRQAYSSGEDRQIFTDYLSFCQQNGFSTGELRLDIGLCLAPFFGLPVSSSIPEKLRQTRQNQSLWKIYLRLQTYCPQGMGKVLQMIKHCE